ncbi:hypothetical protein [Bifidobacterium sp. ESL0790]|uniref:hypothetical protein n=1 Tax=Bifidobacterium sp. ESL0790 TaxID=2983233 RepID=UPI0023F621FA|nr:hypothetical protein [Bifidobacterium sp. ESL0790]WEV72762.1 hypothetical protein OZY47_01945 [Bifidobacterium sp. ESL0790]
MALALAFGLDLVFGLDLDLVFEADFFWGFDSAFDSEIETEAERRDGVLRGFDEPFAFDGLSSVPVPVSDFLG